MKALFADEFICYEVARCVVASHCLLPDINDFRLRLRLLPLASLNQAAKASAHKYIQLIIVNFIRGATKHDKRDANHVMQLIIIISSHIQVK